MSDALALVQRLPVDADPQIWGRAAGIIASIDRYYRGDGARQARYRAFARLQLAPVLARVGWTARPDDAPTTATLREELIIRLGTLGDRAVIAEAQRRFDAGGTDLPTPIRQAVQAVVARHADARMWDRLRALAVAEKTPLIRDQYFQLLGDAADPALARRALALALTDEPGATNSASIINSVSEEHPELAFDFAVANQAAVDKLVDTSGRSRFYAQLAFRSFDPAIVARINAYAAKSLAATSRRPVDEVIAQINYVSGIRRNRLPGLDAWLAQATSR